MNREMPTPGSAGIPAGEIMDIDLQGCQRSQVTTNAPHDYSGHTNRNHQRTGFRASEIIRSRSAGSFVIRHLPLALALFACPCASASVIYEATSPYHNVRVLEAGGLRTLCFDDATESRM
jgi:hypothetical protein